MPSLAVDGSGVIGVSFYDRRSDASNLTTTLFRAISSDGGATWSNQQVSSPFNIPPLSPNFDPAVARCYMGDYNGSAGQAAGFATTWGDNGLTRVTPAFPIGRADPDVRFLR